MRKITLVACAALIIGMLAGAFSAADPGDERFHGGGFDGYAFSVVTNTAVAAGMPAGVVIIIK